MKHRNKLIERKRHAAAIMVTGARRYLLIPTYFQSDIHISQVMGEINLGQRAMDIAAAINNAVEKYESTQQLPSS